ncbi:hypothetical protein ABT052_08445 [Streptomyces sp. NPDC002766]|uniref:hypothetical protein n=1 Tax=Streptomyces sp. NPDC002766 TaxID=3154429 RepID=UPI0033175DF7
MRSVRRSALLLLAALAGLTSCGIPTTGVVEAGGPAGGVVPRVRVYFVHDDALVPVLRQTADPVGVEAAVRLLFQGPTAEERARRLTTLLPSQEAVEAPTPTDGATPAPPTAGSDLSDAVTVTSDDSRVNIEVSVPLGSVDGLAADQIVCTALDAQRIAAPTTTPRPVTVTDPHGRRVEATGRRCPAG